jgi:diphthamide synthase (EF-2-diphthine--ammonia ligase)
LPLVKVPIPSPCPNEVYEQAMSDAMTRARADGVRHVIFGDLFLEDVRAYREKQLAGCGMTPVFPLWGRDTRKLAEDMVAGGLSAYLTCVDPRQLDRTFAGRRFDSDLLAALPRHVDPCGENGEFHTFASAGPMFRAENTGHSRRDCGPRWICFRRSPAAKRDGWGCLKLPSSPPFIINQSGNSFLRGLYGERVGTGH